jgi:hypothetical protein
MTTKTVNLFTFEELSDSAKEKARNWWREVNNDDTFWSECTIDEAKEQGLNMGLEIKDIYWSGFCQQGSGACFVGSWSAANVKTGETAKDWGDSPATKEIRRIAAEFEQFAKDWPESSFSVTHSGHYSHEYCTNFDVSLGEEADNNELVSPEQWRKESDSLIETARDYMRWIYRQLEKEYEYQNSDECIDENILANEYTFLISGKRED